MIKKISLIVAVIIFVTNIYHLSASSNDSAYYSTETLQIARNILNDLGIKMDYDESEQYVTRADVAEWICRLFCMISGIEHGVSDVSDIKANHIYIDVPKDHWANMSIYNVGIIKGLSIMNGYGDSTFRPDKYINYQEFAKVLVSMLGWGYYTEFFDAGYPDGYFNVCDKLGIFPLEKGKMNQPVTKDDAIILLYTSLLAPVISEPALTSSRFYKYSGEIFLNSWFKNISVERGYAKKLNSSQILIDGIEYCGRVNDEKFNEGYVLCFYELVDNKRNIISCYPISCLDFDNLKPISSELPISFRVSGETVEEYIPGLNVKGR